MLVAMFASPRRMRGGSGCLTSESEERETWTAESLRAAFRASESLRANGQEETSAVDVSGQHLVALIDWNRYNFFDDPLCDDLLTIGVDSPKGRAYNPNH